MLEKDAWEDRGKPLKFKKWQKILEGL